MCIALALGAFANVFVAAYIVYRVPAEVNESFHDDTYAELRSLRSFRWSYFPVPPGSVHPPEEERDDAWWETAVLREYYLDSGLGMTMLSFWEEVAFVRWSHYQGERLGWPFFCFRSDYERMMGPDDNDVRIVRGDSLFTGGIDAWELPEWVKEWGLQPDRSGLRAGSGVGTRSGYFPREYFGERQIPIRPMPLGFAANTLFYASPLLVLFVVLPAWKRHRRRRRGLCPRCAYKLAGAQPDAPCPECGANPA